MIWNPDRTTALSEPRVPSRETVMIGAFAATAAVAALESGHAWLGHRFGYIPGSSFTTVPGSVLTWFDLFQRQLASWWIFAGLALIVVRFTQRAPIRPEQWLRTLTPHLVLSVVFALVLVALTTLFRYYVFVRAETVQTLQRIALNRLSLYFATNFLYYWAIVAVTSAFTYYALYRQRALSEARLDLKLSEAQLRSLQTQMQPHFLFNTMNAICGYALQRRHDEVISMLTLLSDLLRNLFRHPPHRAISMAEELAVVKTYIELQQMRLGPRLQVNLTVDERALGAAVPPLLLQPIVENAIQHGIGGAGEGVVDISVGCIGQVVEVLVTDNGPGFRAGAAAGAGSGHGVGMANTAERLQLMYGPRGRLVTMQKKGGATVRILFPYVPAHGTQMPDNDAAQGAVMDEPEYDGAVPHQRPTVMEHGR